jgi:hypothetical protein
MSSRITLAAITSGAACARKVDDSRSEPLKTPGAWWIRSMNRYSAVKTDPRRRIAPPHRQIVAEISEQLGIHMITLYKWRKPVGCRVRWCPPPRRIPRDGARSISSPWSWRRPARTSVNWAPTAGSGVCSPSRWTDGVRPPRMPMTSRCYPWLIRSTSRSGTKKTSGRSSGCSRSCDARTRPWRRRRHC